MLLKLVEDILDKVLTVPFFVTVLNVGVGMRQAQIIVTQLVF